MLALARTVDDAAHHGHLHVLDAWIAQLPQWHLGAQVLVDLLRQFLERGAGGAAASGACGHAGVERAQAERLQDLERDDHFLRARFARLGRQRNADRVADAFLQQHCQRSARRHGALGAHAGLREAQMQRVVAAPCQCTVDADEVLYARHLARQDDLVRSQAERLGTPGRLDRRSEDGAVHDLLRLEGIRQPGVVIHHLRQQFLVEAAPVDADAHRLAITRCHLDHLSELPVVLVALAHVARVDAVL